MTSIRSISFYLRNRRRVFAHPFYYIQGGQTELVLVPLLSGVKGTGNPEISHQIWMIPRSGHWEKGR